MAFGILPVPYSQGLFAPVVLLFISYAYKPNCSLIEDTDCFNLFSGSRKKSKTLGEMHMNTPQSHQHTILPSCSE
jgi:hypothetical protein